MAENTDGAPAAEQAGTGTPTEQQVTTPQGDTGGRGLEDRVKGLVAERERLKAQIEAERKQREAIEEKYKTEDEKRLDQLVQQRVESEYGPVRQRLERIETELTAKRDRLLGNLPESARDCFDESAPVEVQVRQIELVASHLLQKSPGGINSGGNPPAEKRREVTIADYEAWAALAGKFDADSQKRYQELKPVMMEWASKQPNVVAMLRQNRAALGFTGQ